MSKSNAAESDLLSLIFKGTAIAGIADAPASPLSNLYVSLHTADPGEAGDQSTHEAGYGSYGRIAVNRSNGWNVAGNTASNVAKVTFDTATSGSQTITHFGIGTNSTGTGKLLFSAALDSSLDVSTNVIPEFDPGALSVIED